VADSNDWRVTISLTDPSHLEQAQRSISAHEVEEDVRRRLGRSVAFGAGDSQVFLYAGTENAARDAERVARDVLASQGIQAEFALHRWHPIEEEWEDPGVALPRTEAEREAMLHDVPRMGLDTPHRSRTARDHRGTIPRAIQNSKTSRHAFQRFCRSSHQKLIG